MIKQPYTISNDVVDFINNEGSTSYHLWLEGTDLHIGQKVIENSLIQEIWRLTMQGETFEKLYAMYLELKKEEAEK